jgi:uncharacterized protein
MKKIFLFIVTFLTSWSIVGQDITGEWNGSLSVQGVKLRLVFHITKTENGFSGTMDSPDQGAKGIPVTAVSFENPNVKIELTNLRIEYTGEWKEGVISGTFRQAGMTFPLELTREQKVILRPQEPKEPFPYFSEEITFENKKDKITLAGTLTLPKKEGKHPAVVLITGSGAQNRNEELLGHKPFLVLSDYLTRKGIAVLRFDDRGTFASKGEFKTATSKDFATDVESAVNFLLTREEINKKKIGLLGHSEGGIIAPMVAGNMKKVAFIVLLAGTSIRGDQLLLMQQELIMKASGVDDKTMKQSAMINKGCFDIIIRSKNPETLNSELRDYLKQQIDDNTPPEKPAGMSDEEYIGIAMAQLTNPWMLNFIRYDPAPALEKVKCPVLALNGERDLQVPPEINLKGIQESLVKGGNKKVTVHELPGMNHLFQECKTGLPAEYSEIEQTISPVVLDEIATWILQWTEK